MNLFRVLTLAFLLGLVSLGSSIPLSALRSPYPLPLVQFSSGNHVLGFREDGVLISNAAYALGIDFVNAAHVAPLLDATAQSSTGKAPALSRVAYPNLWNGISLAYDAPEVGIVRSSYTLAPYADAGAIRLRYNAPVNVNADGSLSVTYTTGQVNESAPIAWQEIEGKRVDVPVAFVARDEREVGFAVGAHDASVGLVIDPVLTWVTFLGGVDVDRGSGLTVDGNGNVYVVGLSDSSWGSPLRPFTAGSTLYAPDAFVAKLDSAGGLVWNTFLGGAGRESGSAVAMDESGNLYVIGSSTTEWGAALEPYGGGDSDAFVAKLNSDGEMLWNTFLGGNALDTGTDLAVSGKGKLYVAGSSNGTWGAPIRPFTDGSSVNSIDAFAAELDTTGEIVWNTFLGASGDDSGEGIRVYGKNNVYLVGNSSGEWGTPIRDLAGNTDAFVAKLDAKGELQWNTFLGGNDDDMGSAIAPGGKGNVIVTGASFVTWGNPVRAHSNGPDAFVAKLDSDGQVMWNTFLGSRDSDFNQWDEGTGVAVDGNGNAYVTGFSGESWGAGECSGCPIRPYVTKGDAFAAKLDLNGILRWNTFIGSRRYDQGDGIAVDTVGTLYVSGSTEGPWVFPFGEGHGDAMVAKMPAMPACDEKPEAPLLLNPGRRSGSEVDLDWTDAACATRYKVVVRLGRESDAGPIVWSKNHLDESKAHLTLPAGYLYSVKIIARNRYGKTVGGDEFRVW